MPSDRDAQSTEFTPTLSEALQVVDRYFEITACLEGKGCEHGFKPAKTCPNKSCEGGALTSHGGSLPMPSDEQQTTDPPSLAPALQGAREALCVLAQHCIDQGCDSFVWTLRGGPHDPDGGVTDWRVHIGPALAKEQPNG